MIYIISIIWYETCYIPYYIACYIIPQLPLPLLVLEPPQH